MKKDTQKKIFHHFSNEAKKDLSIFKKIQLGFQMFKDHFNGTYAINRSTLLLTIGAVIYAITPFDFDWIPFLGWIDDFAIISYTLNKLNIELERYLNYLEDLNNIEIIGK